MKILIVDDSDLLRRSLSRTLSSLPGVEAVACARDIAGAIDAIQAGRPDVLVLDIQLRGNERGMAVLRYVKRFSPATQVAMLSNFGWNAMREGFVQAGASAYFDKADEIGALRDWIVNRVEDRKPAVA
ncbi:response regulator containing a CheY-like receiver domain and an HTH DNA-binding domain [Burkholderiales bacterium JOSHI_001]|nr:response regulator containing a CheY-like receiver domain and an HTH DNA-binding domain [Burkholderiales bacterium JOSHI_001]